jgi:hypothetical protein
MTTFGAAPGPLRLPPVDRLRSAYTGWTRAHWEAVADHLLDAVVRYASPGFAQLRLPGRESRSGLVSDGLEGFARTFLLAAFRIAGARGEVSPGLIERYAEGLAAGTDPAHPYAWPELADCSQQLVEAASVALALHETRPWIYDRLNPAVRDRVVTWLAGFVGKRTWPGNWIMFQVVVEQFLASVGGPHDPAEISGGLARIDEFYLGEGWYSDGAGQNFDYYIGWAMHLYPLLWARMSGDQAALERYRDRLRPFLDDYQHFFAADGAPVHQGRSLTYRFAAVAPLWLGVLCDATPLSPGVTRRLASGTLRHFVERGAPDEHGLLTLGWYEPYLPCTQNYSGPGSPYWASKAFIGLLLPPDHPVWTDDEQAAPIDTGDHVVRMGTPGWLLHATHDDGVVRLVNHGSDRASHAMAYGIPDPHYAKLAYATHAAPETGQDAATRAVDNHLAVIAPDGTISRRRHIERIAVAAGASSHLAASDHLAAAGYLAASRYEDKLPDGPVRAATASLVHGAWEFRVHRVEAPAGHAVRDGGYAIAADTPPHAEQGVAWAVVRRPGGLTSTAIGLYGFAEAGVARAVAANAIGPCSATPYLLAPDHPGEAVAGEGTRGCAATYVSLIALGGDPVHPDSIRASLRVTVTDDAVSITLPTGAILTTPAGWSTRPPSA